MKYCCDRLGHKYLVIKEHQDWGFYEVWLVCEKCGEGKRTKISTGRND